MENTTPIKATKAHQLPRSLEQLEDVSFSDMTKEELISVAENINDERWLHKNQNEDIKKGYENLFRENAALKEKLQKTKVAAFQQINYFKDTIAMLYRTSLLIKNLEE